MFKIILGWIQQHVAATIIISVVIIGSAVATSVILLNDKDVTKEEDKQYEASQSVVLKKDLNFEVNSDLSLLSLIDNDNKVKIISDDEIVDTSTLGEKELVIKYLDNNQEKEQHVKINIVDTTKPVIEFNKELTTTVGTKIDLLKGVKVSDNSKEEIKSTVEGKYNFDKDGSYNLKYVAIDSSNNKAEEEFILKVNKKQTNSTTPPQKPNTNNNSNTNNNVEEKPNNNTPTKSDPLKKYCDHKVAGYSTDESGICKALYSESEMCNYGSTCFGGDNPYTSCVLISETEAIDENGKVWKTYDECIDNNYPGGKAKYDADEIAWKNRTREKAKQICESRGYGWTNAIDDIFGNCTW